MSSAGGGDIAVITAAAGGGVWSLGATWTGGIAPSAADDAVLAVTSGAVIVDVGAVCRSLTATAYTNVLTHTAGVTLTIGDATAGTANVALALGAGMTYTLGNLATSAISLVSTSATTQTVATGGKTLGNLTITGPAAKVKTVSFTSAVTSSGTFTVTGNSDVNRILIQSSAVGTARSITPTAFSFTNVDFADITAVGTAWTGTSMGNALGNSQITFDTPATQTRTGAGGNWSTAASWTSRVPLPQDNVVIGAGASGTITADMPRLGADVDFTGFTGTAAFSSTANTLYGSLVLGSGMTVSGTQTLTLSARSAKTITSNGKQFTQGVTVNAPGGTYALVDAFNLGPGTVSVAAGAFVSAGFPITCGFFAASAGASVTMGSSVVTLGGTSSTVWSMSAAAIVNAANATIVIASASASARTFGGGSGTPNTYGTLTYTVAGSTGSLTITGSNTFNTINFSDASNARSLLFTAGTTTAITTNWNVFGTAGKLMTVDSATAATHTLTKPTGMVSTDYLSIKNSLAGGGAFWYAGTNSIDQGGNSGWIFTAPPTNASDFFFMFTGAAV